MPPTRVHKRSHRRTNNLKHKRPVRNRRKRSLLKPLLVMLVIGVLGYGVYWTLHAPTFRITKAKVQGQRLLSAGAVWSDVHSGYGQNFFTVDTKSMRKRVMTHPEVADVNIGRRFPNALVVRITERVPAAVLDSGKGMFLVDLDGRPLKKLKEAPSKLPLIQVSSHIDPRMGDPIKDGSVSSALCCVAKSSKNNCRASKISVDQRGNICLNMGSSYFVKLGQPVDISKKLSYLRSTIEARPDLVDKVLYFDISCLERSVWKLKEEAGGSKAAVESQGLANSELH